MHSLDDFASAPFMIADRVLVLDIYAASRTSHHRR